MTKLTKREVVERELDNALERYKKTFRGIGAHACDALEARVWQTSVEFHKILIGAEKSPAETIKLIEEFEERLFGQGDVSYEVTRLRMYLTPQIAKTMLELLHIKEFKHDARRAAFETVLRFQEYDSLPEELPHDLLFDDPLGDGDALYRKTGAGFVIYTRGMNGIDDGFIPGTPDELRKQDAGYMVFGDDEGFVVCYDPIVPAP